ncbi:C40 family peptidase [Salinicola rhizosphaerae]|uniref:Endopeptidase NlpC n=1 Tax=Salinicola rhizosphaerae TaxID=1443141 RepID=A0ABQ3E9E5_9GAMM|nr:NlpC/P60 family protein [Salinicola rhizosphaerae]GHB27765.1 putative endopeptidase NlpC [Salinicola rhizosphaerae]
MLKRTAVGMALALVITGCSAPVKQQQVNAQYALPLVNAPAVARTSTRSQSATQSFQDFKPHLVSPAVIREALLDEHDRWVGTPYVLGGTTHHGIDCSALMQHIFGEAFALHLPRTTEQQVQEGSRVKESDLKAGDLVFFRPPGPYNHVGVYVGDGYFLHASSSRGVKLSRLDNVYWKRYYWQARRPVAQTQLAQRVMLASEG